MQSLDSSRHISEVTPAWSAILGLLVLAAVLVATVLLASKQRSAILGRIGAALGLLAWIVPAVAVVSMIGLHSVRHRVYLPEEQPATVEEGSDHSHTIPVGLSTNTGSPDVPTAVVSPPRLVVRSISTDEPGWIKGPQTANGRELVCLSSQRFATLAEAERQITAEAMLLVKERYKNRKVTELTGVFPNSLGWEPPLEIIDQYAVVNMVGEVKDKDFGNGIIDKIYRAHLKLDFSPNLRDELEGSWRDYTAQQRLVGLGSALGLVTLVLGTFAGYFRLDDATGGAHRWRLKLAAAALIVAGGLVAGSAIHAERSAPSSPPSSGHEEPAHLHEA